MFTASLKPDDPRTASAFQAGAAGRLGLRSAGTHLRLAQHHPPRIDQRGLLPNRMGPAHSGPPGLIATILAPRIVPNPGAAGISHSPAQTSCSSVFVIAPQKKVTYERFGQLRGRSFRRHAMPDCSAPEKNAKSPIPLGRPPGSAGCASVDQPPADSLFR